MKTNCLQLAERLRSGGLDCRFGLIPFGGPGGAISLPSIPLTADLDAFKRAIGGDGRADPGPRAESCVAALEQALKMEFRENASVQFLLITNTPCRRQDEIAQMAHRRRARIKTVVYAEPDQKDVYLPLCQSGGRFYSLRGDEQPAPGGAVVAGGNTEALVSSKWVFDVKRDTVAETMGGMGIYSRRTQANREKWIGQYGGTSSSENAVAEGLNWLARHQADDGHWGPDCLGEGANSKCEAEHRCDGPGQDFPTALTGLAVLAFQAGGHYAFNQHKYSAQVKKGLDWLVENQQLDGALVSNATSGVGRSLTRPKSTNRVRTPRTTAQYFGSFMYEHGIATFASPRRAQLARRSRKARSAFLEVGNQSDSFH